MGFLSFFRCPLGDRNLIDRNHEVVVAVIGCRDRNFLTVGFPEEVLHQIVTAQVAGLVIVVISCSLLIRFALTAHSFELERGVEDRLVVDGHSQLRWVCVDHSQSIAGIGSRSTQGRFLAQAQVREEQDHLSRNVRIVQKLQSTCIVR